MVFWAQSVAIGIANAFRISVCTWCRRPWRSVVSGLLKTAADVGMHLVEHARLKKVRTSGAARG